MVSDITVAAVLTSNRHFHTVRRETGKAWLSRVVKGLSGGSHWEFLLFSDFNILIKFVISQWHGCWMPGGLVWVFSETSDLLEFSRTTISRVYREWSGNGKISTDCLCFVDARCQRRMARLVWADRKATVIQITTRYNMQNSISEHTSNLEADQLTTGNWGYNSLTKRLTKNWNIEDWKNIAWSDESRFLLRLWDRVRIWCKQHATLSWNVFWAF